MRRTIFLELTSCICHQKQLTVCFQIWAKNILIQGDHLYGKPGNVREFETCQGICYQSGNCRGINLVMEKGTKN